MVFPGPTHAVYPLVVVVGGKGQSRHPSGEQLPPARCHSLKPAGENQNPWHQSRGSDRKDVPAVVPLV